MRTVVFVATALLAFSFNLAQAKVDLVKVDKSERKMYLIDDGKIVKEFHVSLGANPKGHKHKKGDERTPEGIYILDYKKDDSSFYKAMHINYPNQADIENAKEMGNRPGGRIMIHGQPNWLGSLPSLSKELDWTHGCIAVTNSEMDEFMELVDVGTTIEIEW